MFKLSFFAVAAMAVLCAPFFTVEVPEQPDQTGVAQPGQVGVATPQPARGPDLPPGAMQAKARTACAECHDARIILQQRLSKTAWTNEVDKMVRWGTLLDPKDHDPLIDYLSTNFPPDKPADAEARIGKAPKGK